MKHFSSRLWVLRQRLAQKQKKITAALRAYQSGETDRAASFNASIKKQVDSKQQQYQTLRENLAAGTLPAEVIADIGQHTQTLKGEMQALKEATPPQDFTTVQFLHGSNPSRLLRTERPCAY